MAKVLPFKGLRYNTNKFTDLAKVTAPPYDIISPDEQDTLYNLSDNNIVRIDFGKEFSDDNDTNNRYTRAGEALSKWIADNDLIFEDAPAFYIYEQIFDLPNTDSRNSFKGIISAVELEEFSKKIILPHEETISKAKTDRLNLMRTTGANISQIYSLYLDDDKSVHAVISEQSAREPDIHFTTPDGIIQNIWIIKDISVTQKITALFENKQLFIADGHHRYETALNYQREYRSNHDCPNGLQSYDTVMMMLVSMDDDGLFVFPTHRMLKNIKDFDETLIVSLLTNYFTTSKIHFTEGDYAEIITERLKQTTDEKLFALYTGEDYYYLLKLKDISVMKKEIPNMPDAYRHLDVTVLHTLILEKHFGIDKENMAQQKNLVYTRSAHEAISAVRSGDFCCSFIINPTKVSEIKEVSLAGEKMPQKSTYFWPKLVTGIVMHKFSQN